jgi:hypothetical protein
MYTPFKPKNTVLFTDFYTVPNLHTLFHHYVLHFLLDLTLDCCNSTENAIDAPNLNAELELQCEKTVHYTETGCTAAYVCAYGQTVHH